MLTHRDGSLGVWCEIRDLNPQENIPSLKELLETGSPDMRKEAAEALRRIEAKPKQVSPSDSTAPPISC